MRNIVVGRIVRLFAITIAVLIPIGAHCSDGLVVEGLASEYDGAQHIHFVIVNGTGERVLVAVAVERLVKGAWQEVSYSISKDDPMKGTVLTDLPPGGRAKPVWDSAELPIESGEYRFRLDLMDLEDPGRTEPVGAVYSPAFRVRPTAKE